MIWESRYWKQPLLVASKRTASIIEVSDPNDDLLGELEHLLMTGFFSVRKLFEAGTKLSSSSMELKYKLNRFPIRAEKMEHGPFPDKMNYHHLDRFYDFDKPNLVEKDLGYVCNQFIHSFVFAFMFDDDAKVESVCVASDKDKNKFCNVFQISDALQIFKTVGNDYPSKLKMQRGKGGEWDVISAS